MRTRAPDYYGAFRCLAGACPHSCCIGWEVTVDEDTALRYFQQPGPLGDRLRAAMQVDEEGDFCFPLRGGRCPFLDGENLCQIHRELGPEATSATCREHPRFTEDYGPLRETSLAASCPAAAELLLGSRAPLTFPEAESEEAGEPGDPWLGPLLAVRGRMFALLGDRSQPLRRRLWEILSLARDAQELLDDDRAEDLPALAGGWRGEESPASGAGLGLFPAGLRFLSSLEALEADWRDLLRAAERAEPPAADPALLERIAAYFLFRHVLKAVNDGELLSRTALCAFAVLAAQRLAAVCGLPEALGRLSRELEHDQDNLEAFRRAFWEREELSLERFREELLQGAADPCANCSSKG